MTRDTRRESQHLWNLEVNRLPFYIGPIRYPIRLEYRIPSSIDRIEYFHRLLVVHHLQLLLSILSLSDTKVSFAYF